MLHINTEALQTFTLPDGVRLPENDVRTWHDERALRGWSEMSRRAARIYLLLALDTIAGLGAVVAAIKTWSVVSNNGLRPVPSAVPLIAMVCCIQPLALHVTGAYGGANARRSLERIAAGVAISALVGWVQAQLFGEGTPDIPNKTAYLYSGALIASYVWLGRQFAHFVIEAGFRRGTLQRRAIVIGEPAEVQLLKMRTACSSTPDTAIVGALSPFTARMAPEAIRDAVRSTGAQMVLIAPSIPFEAFRSMVFNCFECGVGVTLLPRALGSLGSSYFELRESSLGVLLDVFPIQLGLPRLALKRTIDLVLTVGLLALIWPLLVLIAIAVKLDSAGPVFFRQVRAGVGGRSFQILKFRTMQVGADAQKHLVAHLNEYPDARLFKIKADPRVTRLGRLLRRTSLDELPQLFNVVRGEMSLVGPRPCVPDELKHYSAEHFARLFVVPGITGPWQVSGRNEILDFETIVQLERDYIEKWSVMKDFWILLRTIPTLFRRGAY
jgi:exopolysaccharide biosynthesis polyprenyl glycosylphosphotransferase